MALVKDPVKPSDRAEVYRRDLGCIAPQIDPEAGPCRDRWGRTVTRAYQIWMIDNDTPAAARARANVLTLDHVPRHAGSTRVSTPRWMVTACWGHGVANGHRGTVWVTGHRNDERRWLDQKYETPEEAAS